ncbi:glycosyltransferase [Aquibium microcysteis]|uniref:glycosyltransferase n=1 Tax=Aquibium microcysteis TaxID=675281 RepID=UPI00165D119E|nr:glycosyltransferase [Aquibium microcysteis]
MRILFVVHQFRPEFASGTETAVFNIAKSSQRAGHHVAVLTCALGEASRWTVAPANGLWFASVDGIPVHAIPRAMITDPHALHAAEDVAAADLVRAFLADNRFDVVHLAHAMRMGSAIEAVRKEGIPYVVSLTDFFPLCHAVNLVRLDGTACDGPHGGRACAAHCPTGSEPRARFERFRRLLSDAGARIVCSDYSRRQYVRSFPDLGFETIPHGIDVLRACASLGARPPGTGLRFGFLGTIHAKKGAGMLAEAFAAAAVPGASLAFVGPVDFDPATVDAVAAVAGRCPSVTLRGPVTSDEVFAVLSRFDVLCLPSQVPETFSQVLHQAFACGVPALVSDLGAPAEIVGRHGCGWSVPFSDAGAWTQALRRLATDAEEVERARAAIPLPMRIEEEAFFLEHVYRRARRDHTAARRTGRPLP